MDENQIKIMKMFDVVSLPDSPNFHADVVRVPNGLLYRTVDRYTMSSVHTVFVPYVHFETDQDKSW